FGGSDQALGVSQGKTKLMNQIVRPVRVVPAGPVAANHAAQVATPVVGRLLRGLSAATKPHQLVVDAEKRSLRAPVLGTCHMLPAALGQEPVVPAGYDLGAVLQGYAICGLDGGPVGQ